MHFTFWRIRIISWGNHVIASNFSIHTLCGLFSTSWIFNIDELHILNPSDTNDLTGVGSIWFSGSEIRIDPENSAIITLLEFSCHN